MDAPRGSVIVVLNTRLAGRSAVVTGAGSGIGLEIAERLAQEGARVVIADINLESAERVAGDLREQGHRAAAAHVDVSIEDSVRGLMAVAVAELRTIDILCNCAALTDRSFLQQDVDVVNLDLAVWEQTLSVNLTGTMLCCKHAVAVMLEGERGSIVNISSGASLGGGSDLTCYGVSKAGINLLTKSVATQYGRRGIRANAICPGPTITRTSAPGLEDFIRTQFDGTLITPYIGRGVDIANATAFLASDEARFITGQIVSVDGGLFAHSPTAVL